MPYLQYTHSLITCEVTVYVDSSSNHLHLMHGGFVCGGLGGGGGGSGFFLFFLFIAIHMVFSWIMHASCVLTLKQPIRR